MPESKGKVLVIGAGLGGVSAAISLALEGYDVDVYEKNSRIGGKLNVLKKDGFSFDLGPSILTMPRIFEALFTRAGKDMEDYVPVRKLPLQWRCFFTDKKILDLYADPSETVKKNPWLNKGDEEDLRRFNAYAKKLYETVERGYFAKGLDTLPEVVRHYGPLSSVFGFDISHTMHQGVVKRVKNRHLRYALDHFIKYVGSSPYDAPAVLNILPYIQFEYGLWYVDGGMYGLAEGLRKLMEETNVELHLNSEVVELKKEGKKVVSAVLANGSKKKADIYVSNMEVIPAYERLLKEEGPMLDRYKKRFEPACSGYVLHLGVKGRYEQLAHHNFFFSNDPKKGYEEIFHEKKLPEDPTIYLVSPSRTDPAQAPAGCENLKILPHVPYIQDKPFTRRDYAKLRERVLDKLEGMGLTDLRKRIITEDDWTPEDIRERYYSNRGAIYGIVSDRKKNRGFKAPKKSELYGNLYFVGGSVNPGGGMPMATLSGQQVKDMILEGRAAGRHP
ncbi:MAG: phytoene desaturase [Candidatus Altiarchaeota archaeon]|nr:phytoene desaturase [Candidatus Altiarchaeota archaeon]